MQRPLRNQSWMAGVLLGAAVWLLWTGPGCSAPEARVVPELCNVADVRSPLRGDTLLHFTPEQWDTALSKARRVEELRADRVWLEAAPLPAARGMLVSLRCPPGCTPELLIERPDPPPGPGPGPGPGPDPGPVGYTPLPDTVLIPRCDCPDDDGFGGGQGPLPQPAQPTECRLVIDLHPTSQGPVARTPVLRCEEIDCDDCEFAALPLPQGGFLLGCLCE